MCSSAATMCLTWQGREERVAGHKVPFLQYVGCLAVVAALQELFAQRLGDAYVASDFPIRIKWPNDVHVTRPGGTSVKLGGILGQTVSGRGAHSTVMGVGLNVTNAEPTTCANSVLEDMASRHGIGVEPLSRGTVLAAVLNHFEVFVQVCARLCKRADAVCGGSFRVFC